MIAHSSSQLHRHATLVLCFPHVQSHVNLRMYLVDIELFHTIGVNLLDMPYFGEFVDCFRCVIILNCCQVLGPCIANS